MALILFGMYVLVADKVRISPHCGLRGKGARLAGALYMVLGVGFLTVFNAAIIALHEALELPFGAAVALSGVLQIATFFLVPLILVRIYGNAFARRLHRRSESLRDR
jgi:hypothetical protein